MEGADVAATELAWEMRERDRRKGRRRRRADGKLKEDGRASEGNRSGAVGFLGLGTTEKQNND